MLSVVSWGYRGAVDNSDTFDNCNLAFSSECVEVLNARPSKDDYALSGMDDSLKSPLYEADSLTTVGMGWFDCGGEIYWTVLAAGEGYSAGEAVQQPAAVPAPAVSPAPAHPAPAPAQAPVQSHLAKWFAYFSTPHD